MGRLVEPARIERIILDPPSKFLEQKAAIGEHFQAAERAAYRWLAHLGRIELGTREISNAAGSAGP